MTALLVILSLPSFRIPPPPPGAGVICQSMSDRDFVNSQDGSRTNLQHAVDAVAKVGEITRFEWR